MKKNTKKSVGDQLFIKRDIRSPWELASLSDLKSQLSLRVIPYSSTEKLSLPQFGYGRSEGKTSNQQLYPTKTIVFELDTPRPYKGELEKDDIFEKWSSTFKSIYKRLVEDSGISYKIIYLTPSMCGLRFVIRLENPIKNEDEYIIVVKEYVKQLEDYGVVEEFLDIKVNCGWFVPTYKNYYSIRTGVFQRGKTKPQSAVNHSIRKALKLTGEVERFETGNRNRFIYLFSRNGNRLGIEQQDLLDFILKSEYAYDSNEISATIKSAYKKKDEFGIWKDKSDIGEATVSLESLIRRSKNIDPIPLIWNGVKQGSLGFVFGPAKSGKSTFCESLAMSLAAGLDSFMGLPIHQKDYKVLYISLEEHWQNRVERNRLQRTYLFQTYRRRLNAKFFTNNEKYPLVVFDDSDLKFIEEEINKCDPDIVFIDSFTRLMTVKVEDSTHTNTMMFKLKKMCNDTGATFIIIHHTTKAKDKYLNISQMAGSRILAQEGEFHIGITKSPNGIRYVKDVLFRYAPEKDTVIPFEINESRWVIHREQTFESELIERTDGRKDDSNKQAIYSYIQASEIPVSSSELKNHFEAQMSKKTMFNNLNKLLEESKIEKVDKGLYQCSVEKEDE